MKTLTTATGLVAAAAIAMTATSAPAQAQEFYSLYLTGVQVAAEGPHRPLEQADDAFVVTYIVEQNGHVTNPVILPGANQPWRGLNVGDIFPLNELVWRGPEQNIDLHADLYQYDSLRQDFLGGFVGVTTAISGALISVGTGGVGAAAGVGVAAAGQAASQAVRDAVGADSIPLGEVIQPIELPRVGTLADRPQNEHYGVWYDFFTEHTWNGAHYYLYWEVRR